MKKLKIIQATDGTFAICDFTQVTPSVGIWSLISAQRYTSEIAAKCALMHMSSGSDAPAPAKEEKPEANLLPKASRNRDDYRIVKLDKGVFAVEQKHGAKWVEIGTKKTRAKAESVIIKSLTNGD